MEPLSIHSWHFRVESSGFEVQRNSSLLLDARRGEVLGETSKFLPLDFTPRRPLPERVSSRRWWNPLHEPRCARDDRLARQHGEQTPDGLRIRVKLSQREIGEFVGKTREAVNKQLRHWTDDGLLSMLDGHILIRDVERLEDIADGYGD